MADHDGDVKELLEAAADLLACETALNEARAAVEQAIAAYSEARRTFMETIGSFGMGRDVRIDDAADRLAVLIMTLNGGSNARSP